MAFFKILLPWSLLTALIISDVLKKSGLDEVDQQQYFFVIRSFKSSKKFLINGAKRCGTFTMVNIVDPETSTLLKRPIKCKIIGSSTKENLAITDYRPVTVSSMLKPGFCRIETVALFCPLADAFNEKVVSEASDGIPRKLVYCIGRRFFFESWHLLITSLELARLQEVDMVVLYLLSIQSAIYELAKLYASNGFLRIRSSLKMPTDIFKEMGFNPNMESEWNNEAIEYNECLYEHREQTNFIAFTTLDDIIISSPPKFEPLPPIFTNLSNAHPHSPEFLLRVHDSFLKNLDDIVHDLKTNSIDDFIRTVREFWRNGIYLNAPIVDPRPTASEFYTKIVVIPERVEVVWLHRATKIEPGGSPLIVPYKNALIMHLRHPLESGYNNTFPIIKQLNTENARLYSPLIDIASNRMVDNFRFVLNGHANLSSMVERLPRTESFLNEFRTFNIEFHNLLKKIKENATATSRCSNYLHHGPLTSQMTFGCVNARNKWKHERLFDFKNESNDNKTTIFNIAILNERLLKLDEKCSDF